MTLLEKFADPNIITSLSFGDKMLATFYVTVLGMGITFLALLTIWAATLLLSKVVKKLETKKVPEVKEIKTEVKKVDTAETVEDDLEIVAVISAAIAAMLGKNVNQIKIKNITRSSGVNTEWSQSGLIEQINNRF